MPEHELEEILADWDEDPTGVAEKVIATYGEPDVVTQRRLMWYGNGPWKRSVLRPDGADHEFPEHHIDYLEQVIDYHVPPASADDVIRFDGSVTIRRTRGELSAECHGEPANFLAINLTHDILEGDKTVEEARDVYAEIYARKEAGDEPAYITDLQFELPSGDQADPDVHILSDEHRRAAEQYTAD